MLGCWDYCRVNAKLYYTIFCGNHHANNIDNIFKTTGVEFQNFGVFYRQLWTLTVLLLFSINTDDNSNQKFRIWSHHSIKPVAIDLRPSSCIIWHTSSEGEGNCGPQGIRSTLGSWTGAVSLVNNQVIDL